MDKVIHSAVGLGMCLSYCITLNIWILIGLVVISILKEVFDYLRYGKFDKQDIYATLNPLVVVKWYLRQIKK